MSVRQRAIAARRRMLRPFISWCNRNLSQRNLQWIADHSFGWTKLEMKPISIPGTSYQVTAVKITDWLATSEIERMDGVL